MPYNLIEEAWIPIRRADGTTGRIAPWQITDGYSDTARRVVALQSPRPDFDGALVQFLIGLAQTCIAPRDNAEWRKMLKNPPAPETLHEAFAPVAHAFNFDGDGPRFMQDLQLRETDDKPLSISALLMDAPGEQTEKLNKDHFIKRGSVHSMCYSCTATALFALQTNAPSGGQGHRTSLRGGGPLTTILYGEDLWATMVFNLLCSEEFDRLSGNATLTSMHHRFPWLAPTRTSEKDTGMETTTRDCHPLQMYWTMPRRIRLLLSAPSQGTCPVCGYSGVLCSYYVAKNYGINYSGAWQHPLSPYGRNKENEPFALHPNEDTITYRHWVAFVFGDETSKIAPATVIQKFRTRMLAPPPCRIAAFGFETDNMKVRAWHYALQPYLAVPSEHEPAFCALARQLRDAAVNVAKWLSDAIKEALCDPRRDASLDAILFQPVHTTFWHDTEPHYYSALAHIAAGEDALPIKEQWCSLLQQAARAVFDSRANAPDMTVSNIKRLVTARNKLLKLTAGRKLRESILQLPPLTPRKKRRQNE